MAEPQVETVTNGTTVHGVVAEFSDVDSLLAACRRVRDAGFTKADAFTPFPVHGIDKALGIKPTVLPWIALVAGLSGTAIALVMQIWMNGIDYQYIISGKPFISLPAFIPVTFELTILLASFGTFFGMWALNGLPRFSNPMFTSPRFDRATDDTFFLFLDAKDPRFEEQGARALLSDLGGQYIEPVVEDESPQSIPKPLLVGLATIIALSFIPALVVARMRVTKSGSPRFHIFPDMDFSPAKDAQQSATLFADGRAMRPDVPGTVSRGELTWDLDFQTGIDMEALARVDAGRANRLVAMMRPDEDTEGDGTVEEVSEQDEASEVAAAEDQDESTEEEEPSAEEPASENGEATSDDGDAASGESEAAMKDGQAEPEVSEVGSEDGEADSGEGDKPPASEAAGEEESTAAETTDAAADETATEETPTEQSSTGDSPSDSPSAEDSPKESEPAPETEPEAEAAPAEPTQPVDTTPWLQSNPLTLTADVLQRGQQQFNIYCAVCHGMNGRGNGLVNQRAQKILATTWTPPSNLHDETLYSDAYPEGKLFSTITNGIRKMPGYAGQIRSADRWAVVAYVRALQASRDATLQDVPEDRRPEIEAKQEEVRRQLEEAAAAEAAAAEAAEAAAAAAEAEAAEAAAAEAAADGSESAPATQDDPAT